MANLKITGTVKVAFNNVTKKLHIAIISSQGTTDKGQINFS